MFRQARIDGYRESRPDEVAALSLAHAVPASVSEFGRAQPGARARMHALADHLSGIDWTPDLAQNIGSKKWWRGLATLTGLCTAAWLAWPGIIPLNTQAPPIRKDDWEQARALTITPLAWGGDTGRKMAATDAVQPLAEAPERPRIELTATLGQGDGFARVLERSGVGSAEAARITAMVANAVSVSDIAPGTRIDLILGRRTMKTQPRPVESLAFRAALDLRLEFARTAGVLSMERIRIAVDDTPLRIRGRVGNSIYLAARSSGVPATAIQTYLRVIAGQLSLTRDVNADDQFDMIIAHRQAETGEEEFGELLYAGLVRGDRARLRMLPWTVDGRMQWFEASGVGQQKPGLAMPVNGRVTSGFGMRRHPILGYTRMHAGIDFGAPYGSPVYAVTDGNVNYAGYKGGYGQFIGLNHGGGMGTGYGHLSRIAVRSGQYVRRGQVIGYVGNSGLSTGPHLHYELYRNGAPINPAGARFVTQATLSGGQLAAFRARLNALTSLQPGLRKRPVAAAAATSAGAGTSAGTAPAATISPATSPRR